MTESDISKNIQVDLSRYGARLFRYPVGLYYTANGLPIRIGVPGISDHLGFVPVKITQEMVGKTILQFLAVEVKKPEGNIKTEQLKFINFIKSKGGQAFIATSASDAISKIKL